MVRPRLILFCLLAVLFAFLAFLEVKSILFEVSRNELPIQHILNFLCCVALACAFLLFAKGVSRRNL
jgi:hypothetical protein